MTEVLAWMVELARSRGHDNDAQTVQDLFYDFQMQEMTRNANTPPEPTVQFPLQIPPETRTSVGKARNVKLTSKPNLPPADGDVEPQLRKSRSRSRRSRKERIPSASRINPAEDESIQSDSGDPDWVPGLKWKMKHPGGPRPPYVLDAGFHTISEATYENMPDPTTELSPDQLGLLRQGFLTFYDLSLHMLKEISNTKLGVGQKKTTKCGMVSEVSYTLQILMSIY